MVKKKKVFIYVIILRVLSGGEGGSIKCGHLDEGVFCGLFVFFAWLTGRQIEADRTWGGMMSAANSCCIVSVNRGG